MPFRGVSIKKGDFCIKKYRRLHGNPVLNILLAYVTLLLTMRHAMIKLTRLNNSLIVVNSELIEHIEALPDTIITLTTGQKIIVRESVDEIIEKAREYRRSLAIRPFAES
jgi:flagellar protein FlbD